MDEQYDCPQEGTVISKERGFVVGFSLQSGTAFPSALFGVFLQSNSSLLPWVGAGGAAPQNMARFTTCPKFRGKSLDFLPVFSLKHPVFGTEAAECPISTEHQRGSRSRSESFTRWAIAH